MGAGLDRRRGQFGYSDPTGGVVSRAHNGGMALQHPGLLDRHDLGPAECRERLGNAQFARVVVSIRCLPAARLVHTATIGNTIYFASAEVSVISAARRGDVLTLQIDGASSDGGTWTVLATGMSWVVPHDDVATHLPSDHELLYPLAKGATLMAIPLTLIRGDHTQWSFPSRPE